MIIIIILIIIRKTKLRTFLRMLGRPNLYPDGAQKQRWQSMTSKAYSFTIREKFGFIKILADNILKNGSKTENVLSKNENIARKEKKILLPAYVSVLLQRFP